MSELAIKITKAGMEVGGKLGCARHGELVLSFQPAGGGLYSGLSVTGYLLGQVEAGVGIISNRRAGRAASGQQQGEQYHHAQVDFQGSTSCNNYITNVQDLHLTIWDSGIEPYLTKPNLTSPHLVRPDPTRPFLPLPCHAKLNRTTPHPYLNFSRADFING